MGAAAVATARTTARTATLIAASAGLLAAGAGVAAAQPAAGKGKGVQGVVSRVTDGDSLWVRLPDGKGVEVRLRDIDAPEICQPWGLDARKALAELVQDKVVTLQGGGRDGYGRTIGAVLVDELSVGPWMVENGHAWSVRSRWDQGPLVKQEKVARALARGLHAQAGAVQPWEWRRTRGACPAAAEAGTAAPAAGKAR
jgi:endonuclease YncB( thermonuclease family)